MATQEDAQLMVQIMQWATASGSTEAFIKLSSPSFDPATASADDKDILTTLLMGEMIGTFVKRSLLDAELVYDLWAPGLFWSLVGPAALRQREQFGVDGLWENFEALANG